MSEFFELGQDQSASTLFRQSFLEQGLCHHQEEGQSTNDQAIQEALKIYAALEPYAAMPAQRDLTQIWGDGPKI